MPQMNKGGKFVFGESYEVPDGTFLPYKGRSYCWTAISAFGEITLTEEMMVGEIRSFEKGFTRIQCKT